MAITLDTSNSSNYHTDFSYLLPNAHLVKIILDSGSTETSLKNFFKGNRYLVDIENLSKITFKDGLDISGMFEDCENLINVDLRNLDYTTIEHAENMFKNCKHLNTIRMDNLVASVDPSIFHDFLYNTGFYLYDDKFGNPVRCVEIVININTALELFPENEMINNIGATGDNNVRLYINNETILAAMGDESGYTSVADNILAQVAYSSIDPSSAKHCFIKLMCSSSDYDVAVQSELLRDDIYSDIIDNDFDGDAYLFLEFTNLSVIRIPFTNLSESTIPFVKIQFQSKDDSAGVNIQMDVTCEELFKNLKYLRSIVNLGNVSLVINDSAEAMFMNCGLLESADIFTTEFASATAITNYKNMFLACTSFYKEFIATFDVRDATSMEGMFASYNPNAKLIATGWYFSNAEINSTYFIRENGLTIYAPLNTIQKLCQISKDDDFSLYQANLALHNDKIIITDGSLIPLV